MKPVVSPTVASVESGFGTLSLSNGSMPISAAPSSVPSVSLSLDESSGGSIVAGLPPSPVPISESCKWYKRLKTFVFIF